jgi:hypothetical protein
LYASVWSQLLREPHLVPAESAAVLDEPNDPLVHYLVVTEEGKPQVFSYRRDDPAGMLVEVQKRFGEVKSLQRVDGDTAERLRSIRISRWLRRGFGAMLLFPLAALVAGIWLRSRQVAFESLWKALRPTLSANATELTERTGLSTGALRAAIERVNARGLAQLEWDTEFNRIADVRLSSYNITLEYCERCNEALDQRVPADLKQVPRCPSCMFQHNPAHLDELKRPIVEQLLEESAAARERVPEASGFSLLTFAVLLLFFPPAAIAYAARQT